MQSFRPSENSLLKGKSTLSAQGIRRAAGGTIDFILNVSAKNAMEGNTTLQP